MWIVSQIGAREHYSIARALQQSDRLGGLVTDFWIQPNSAFGKLPGARRLRDRFHPDIHPELAWAPNWNSLLFEVTQRLSRKDVWASIQKRDRTYQQQVIPHLRRLSTTLPSDATPTLFSYSYAAKDLFKEAKQLGWHTVLGQIDPGPAEHELVGKLGKRHPEWNDFILPKPPQSYWDSWREECDLADRIVVNSAWSASLLSKSGIDQSKLEVIPLAYENSARSLPPETFDQRPLRLLFLGQAIVRKGIHDLVAAARNLDPTQWQIDVVGPHPPLPGDLPEAITFHGVAPRSEVEAWYSQSDVFVLPTHSDGFAITQLEAMAHGLPVIATPCCGDVVEEGRNGWIIPAGDSGALIEQLKKIADAPEQLPPMREAALATLPDFSLNRIGESLLRPRAHAK